MTKYKFFILEKVIMSVDKTEVSGPEGSRREVTCTASGKPLPVIGWKMYVGGDNKKMVDELDQLVSHWC